ncbi:PDDEXK nuclease domain-containing protein [Pseudarthrobacter sp. PS3-L1]|uniref:PDDEXK nuclease domain-containing protein n=1 Tax=Pseudarthrobacter sp. PS3-L1 TaxID=3046207 RepID=UPI0024B9C53F|nr:PDDEXK nuclease domain-containing protein [Pseudarthrobacter sp. PS3-L1]MDJ0318989.1 hypothetical protein [Pseudarthrobacter sp. PS3-L1]
MKNRYVVTELKTGKFQPPHAGKLNFYIALVDDALRRAHHNGTYTSSMAVAAAASIYNKIPTAEQKHLGKRPSPTIFYDDRGEPILDYTNDPGNT